MRTRIQPLLAGVTVFGLGLLPVGSSAMAQRPRLEARLDSLRSAGSLPAIAGAVFRSAEILDVAAVGVRKAGSAAAVTTADLWHIGSLTKSFTSLLAAKFVERRSIEWSSTVAAMLAGTSAGDTRGVDSVRGSRYYGVTLTQLLSHRAGLPANVPGSLTIVLLQSGAPVREQRKQILEAILGGEPEATPGERFLYSNIGYIMVGAILEARTGKAWEALLQEEVLAPLQLSSAGFGAPGIAGQLNQPRGHTQSPGGALNGIEPGPGADNPAYLGPAGTLHMSVADLARWGQVHLRGERGQGGIISAASFKTLHSPPVVGEDYAMGWVVRRDGARRTIWHNGSNTLWYAVLAFDPDADIGVALVTNGGIGARAVIDAAVAQLIRERSGIHRELLD